MAGFYLDNDVSLRLVHDLRMSGHHVVSALELDLTKATDDEHLLVAVLRSLILVTHNRKDFTLLHDAWQRWPRVLGVSLPRHPGILVLDQAPPDELSEVLASFMQSTAQESVTNELIWWRSSGGWLRRIAGTGWAKFG